MYKIDYQNKEVTIEAVDKLVWVSVLEKIEEDVTATIPFDKINELTEIDLYHNIFYAFFSIKTEVGEIGVCGETGFISEMYEDFKKIKKKGVVRLEFKEV